MTEIIKETVATPVSASGSDPIVVPTVVSKATGTQTMEHMIYFLFGALEILLVFRLILKVTGASSLSAFVAAIYGITGLFILPFEGIFRSGFSQGVETTAVLEPSTIVAIVVYAILALAIAKFIEIGSREQH